MACAPPPIIIATVRFFLCTFFHSIAQAQDIFAQLCSYRCPSAVSPAAAAAATAAGGAGLGLSLDERLGAGLDAHGLA